MTTKLFLIDDHEVVRVGIKHLVRDTEFEVVQESDSLETLSTEIAETDANIVLLDVMIGSENAFKQLEMAKRARPEIPVVIYSAFDNPAYMKRAIALKTAGYVLKSNDSEKLLYSLRKVVSEGTAWSNDDLRRVSGAMATPRLDSESEVPLTRRESEVLTHLVAGLTNKEIAGELHISYETVKEHVQHVLRKLGVSDRTQAAVWAVRRGLA